MGSVTVLSVQLKGQLSEVTGQLLMIREAGFKPRFLTFEEPQTVTASVMFAQGAWEVELELPLGGVGGGQAAERGGQEARPPIHGCESEGRFWAAGQPGLWGRAVTALSQRSNHPFVFQPPTRDLTRERGALRKWVRRRVGFHTVWGRRSRAGNR